MARGVSIMRHIVNVWVVDGAVINDKRTSIPFCQKTDALTRKSEKNRNNQALTRERRPAKRNPHLASVRITDKRISIPFCQKTDALTRKSEKNRNGQALTRERRPAKRNPHLASAQVNGRAAFSMLRTLAGEGFRLERMPLRVTARRGCYCALLRVRGCGCRPNGMELPLSLVCGLTMMRCVDGARGVDNAAHR